jgi:hypothetical protein
MQSFELYDNIPKYQLNLNPIATTTTTTATTTTTTTATTTTSSSTSMKSHYDDNRKNDERTLETDTRIHYNDATRVYNNGFFEIDFYNFHRTKVAPLDMNI